MNRRDLIKTVVSLAAVSSSTTVIAKASFSTDLEAIKATFLSRLPEVKHIYDYMNIYEDIVYGYMAEWGNLKPLKQVYIQNPDGSDRKPFGNLKHDPNFWDGGHFWGMGTDGFTLCFEHPYDPNKIIRVRYYAVKQELVQDIKNRL